MSSRDQLHFKELMRPYKGQRMFDIDMFGIRRRLDLRELQNDKGHWIASDHSVIFGDLQFLSRVAKELADLVRIFRPEVLLTAESKAILLTGKISDELHLENIEVARKSLKAYNRDSISTEIRSTISGKENLFLDITSQRRLRGKNVGLIDDVVTTGGNITGLERLVKMCGGKTVVKACVWIEGYPLSKQAFESRRDLIYLGKLPEFFDPQRLRKIRNARHKLI